MSERWGWALLLAFFLVAVGGCNTNPTSASALSPEDEKRFEEEAKKGIKKEGGQKEKGGQKAKN